MAIADRPCAATRTMRFARALRKSPFAADVHVYDTDRGGPRMPAVPFARMAVRRWVPFCSLEIQGSLLWERQGPRCPDCGAKRSPIVGPFAAMLLKLNGNRGCRMYLSDRLACTCDVGYVSL